MRKLGFGRSGFVSMVGAIMVLGSAGASQVDAAALLLKAGTAATNNVADLARRQNTPAHVAGSVPLTDLSNFSNFVTADRASGLIYSDSTAATGVALDLAAANGTSTTVPSALAFGATPQPSSNIAGGIAPGGMYGPTPTTTLNGATWQSSGSASTFSTVGARITGLAFGEYLVYVTGRNTNAGSGTNSENISIEATGLVSAYSVPTTGLLAMSNTTNASWIEGNTYVVSTVTIDAINPAITVTATGSVSDKRGFLNSIEIVPVEAAVPEPATGALLALAAGTLLVRRRSAMQA